MSDGNAGDRPQWAGDLVMGLRFFSRLPTGPSPHEAPDLGRIAPLLPVASVLIGAGPALLLPLLAALGLPPLVVAGLGLAASMLVTGAMSEDAIADAADGLGGGSTPERRLEIMKDSRHGTYGVMALVLMVLLRAGALAALVAANPFAAAGIWLSASLIGRSAGLWLPVALPPARDSGAAASAGRPRPGAVLLGLTFATVLAVLLAGPFTSLLAVGAALFVAAALARGWQEICTRLAGGQTGDLTGALIGFIEGATLLVFVGFY